VFIPNWRHASATPRLRTPLLKAMRQHRDAARHGGQSAYQARPRRPTGLRGNEGSDVRPPRQRRHPKSKSKQPSTLVRGDREPTRGRSCSEQHSGGGRLTAINASFAVCPWQRSLSVVDGVGVSIRMRRRCEQHYVVPPRAGSAFCCRSLARRASTATDSRATALLSPLRRDDACGTGSLT
jgi:hypothetical protein